MDRLHTLIKDVVRQIRQESRGKTPMHTIDINLTEDGVLVEFSNGRQQHISVSQQSGYYRLTSVILKRSYVEKIGRGKILPFIWQRNRESNLVAFGIDTQDRPTGGIEQPSETDDAGEMLLYLEHLAWECDQLEYTLSGVEAS